MKTRTAPPSQNSILSRQKKTLNRKSVTPIQNKDRPRRKVGHNGVSHNRKDGLSTPHKPEKCARCNGIDLHDKSHHVKQITDIESIPKCSTTSHIMYQSACTYCNHVTESKDVGIPGTSMGRNIATLMTDLWRRNVSLYGISEFMKSFGLNVCKATVQHILDSVPKRMKSEKDRIADELSESKCGNLDETVMPVCGKRLNVWDVLGHGGKAEGIVLIFVSNRSKVALDMHFPHYFIPITVDRYAGYNEFKTR